jgi:hypothetical protein
LKEATVTIRNPRDHKLDHSLDRISTLYIVNLFLSPAVNAIPAFAEQLGGRRNCADRRQFSP